MKKRVYLILGVCILVGMGSSLMGKSQINNKSQISKPTPLQLTTNHSSLTTSHSLFVPYWSLQLEEGDMKYDTYYYFGVRPTSEGTFENEVGLQNIALVDSIPEKQKKLVLRMFDTTVTEAILQDKTRQEALISEAKKLVTKKSFSGIVLDIEVPYTLQAQKKQQITEFVQQMCTAIKSDYKTCDMLIYGDFSYRNRPYDLKSLGKVTDTILLMAYDFHKAGGEPGPNFSFEDKKTYGYDFKTMIQDVTSLVPKEKIEIVFGMYGYDWTLNEQGTPLKTAQALSVNDIKSKVLKSQGLKIKSNWGKEKSIEYVDAEGRKHVIWYEDEESAAIKTKYLFEMGISRVSFWAQSYF